MDYSKIGEMAVDAEPFENYHSYYSEFLPEQEMSEAAKEEVQKAKAFLSAISPTSNLSVYDHMKSILSKILLGKIENAVDVFEDLSLSLKSEMHEEKSGYVDLPDDDNLLKESMNSLRNFFQSVSGFKEDVNPEIKSPGEDAETPIEEEDVNDPEVNVEADEIRDDFWDLLDVVPNVGQHMYRFGQAGVGLGVEETFKINLSLKVLAKKFQLQTVRFWGKILGTGCNYYIAETLYREDIKPDEFGWQPTDEAVLEMSEGTEDETLNTDTEDQVSSLDGGTTDEEVKVGDGTEQTEGDAPDESTEAPKIPPLPKHKPPLSRYVPDEKNGTGVNQYLYFICSKPGLPWKCLPQLSPVHIVDARLSKKFFSGILDAEVRGCVPFQGKEAHYLRAQIARISASTHLAPAGYYYIPEESNEEDNPEPEDDKPKPEKEDHIELNPNYEALSIKDLFSEGLSGWVHQKRAILYQGRCTWIKTVMEEENEENTESVAEGTKVEGEEERDHEEEEEPETKEKAVPLLRALSEDKGAGGVIPWSVRLSSKLLNECAVIIVRSNLWPGAFTYFDGKTFENIYIGHGHKYSTRDYAPWAREMWQKEYTVGPDVIEPVDELEETISVMSDETEGESTEVSTTETSEADA